MGNRKTKEGLYILIAIVTLALVILIIMYNWYYVYRNVNQIKRVADDVIPDANQVSRILCNGIRDAAVVNLIANSEAITRAQNRCVEIPP